jgi:hypothetical protein
MSKVLVVMAVPRVPRYCSDQVEEELAALEPLPYM